MSIQERVQDGPSLEVLFCDVCEKEISARTRQGDPLFEQDCERARQRMQQMQGSEIARYFNITEFEDICVDCEREIRQENADGAQAEEKS